ncbi:RTA1 like protein [Cercophora newfieldiana]|uniref:RTA1 like protein n=1 Tax=Cercophora newfieldiana TaxID=92897 RepID=A0AA39Y9J4_9PEZI|nr:RTA1 like protein [Cercophora newfieldiana]
MSSNSTGPGRVFRPSYDTCSAIGVSDICPVRATTIGYYPNEGVNAFLAAGFGLCTVVTLVIGIWKRTWSYSLAVAAGCALELAGYASRVALSSNPWNSSAFKTQIVAIILGPTLICIGLYLTLKHAVKAINPSLSRVSPHLYPLFFIPADVSCLVIQAIGGGLAAAGGHEDMKLLQNGNRMIIAGIVLQVVVLGVFGLLAGEYLFRVRKWIANGPAPEEAKGAALWRNTKFRMFVYGMMGAYATLFIRCVYRIAEMAGGWGNHIMQDEPSFVVLESFMVLIASCLLAGFAPGIFFPQMAGRGEEVQKAVSEGGRTDGELSGADAEKRVSR